jgi:hypothetical protein
VEKAVSSPRVPNWGAGSVDRATGAVGRVELRACGLARAGGFRRVAGVASIGGRGAAAAAWDPVGVS